MALICGVGPRVDPQSVVPRPWLMLLPATVLLATLLLATLLPATLLYVVLALRASIAGRRVLT